MLAIAGLIMSALFFERYSCLCLTNLDGVQAGVVECSQLLLLAVEDL